MTVASDVAAGLGPFGLPVEPGDAQFASLLRG
jgi:hypothetical protein